MQGLLIPKFHQNYWMGLLPNSSVDATPKPWYWIDRYNPAPGGNGTYSGWGVLMDPPASIPEPNNYLGDENCSVGNWSEAAGTPPNWGWADTQCNRTFVNICRMQSGRTRPGEAPLPASVASVGCCAPLCQHLVLHL